MDENAPPGGVVLSECWAPTTNKIRTYASCKAASFFLGTHFARQLKADGIISIIENPGNLTGQMFARVSKIVVWAVSPVLYHPRYGAYTSLWTGLSNEVSMEDTGRYAIPWGRWHPKIRKDILNAMKSKEEGGTGNAAQFLEWCEKETTP